MVAGAAEFAEMRSAVNLGRHLVGDELGDLLIVFPCGRDAERLAKFGLICGFQLGIVKNVLAIIESELVAVIEHAPALALVHGDRFVERMVVVEVRLVHVFVDIVVDRQNDAAVGEGGYPGRLDVENVVGAGIGDVLGDRLGVLVGMRKFDDVEVDSGQRLPKGSGEILRLERLQAGLIGEVEGDALVLVSLRRLHRPKGRSIRRTLARRLDRGPLGLAQRGALVGELDLRDIGHRGPRLGAGRRVAEPREHRGAAHLQEPGQECAARGVPPKPCVDFLGKPGVEVARFAIVHHLLSSLDAAPAVPPAGRPNLPTLSAVVEYLIGSTRAMGHAGRPKAPSVGRRAPPPSGARICLSAGRT